MNAAPLLNSVVAVLAEVRLEAILLADRDRMIAGRDGPNSHGHG